MTLDLNKFVIYADPYTTNWNYLDNMTALQMKALGTMLWSEDMEYIYTGLKNIPRAWAYEEPAKRSVKGFIHDLNNEIKRL